MKLRNLILLMLLISCKTTNIKYSDVDKDIVYVLPLKVEEKLKDHLSKTESKEIVLDLQRFENNFIIFVHNNPNIFWSKTTNRKVLIGTKLYPLLIDLDFLFASTKKSKQLIELIKANNNSPLETVDRIAFLSSGSFNVKFTKKGEILSFGYN